MKTPLIILKHVTFIQLYKFQKSLIAIENNEKSKNIRNRKEQIPLANLVFNWYLGLSKSQTGLLFIINILSQLSSEKRKSNKKSIVYHNKFHLVYQYFCKVVGFIFFQIIVAQSFTYRLQIIEIYILFLLRSSNLEKISIVGLVPNFILSK